MILLEIGLLRFGAMIANVATMCADESMAVSLCGLAGHQPGGITEINIISRCKNNDETRKECGLLRGQKLLLLCSDAHVADLRQLLCSWPG